MRISKLAGIGPILAAGLLLNACGGSATKDPCVAPVDFRRCAEPAMRPASPAKPPPKHAFGDCSSHDLINFTCE